MSLLTKHFGDEGYTFIYYKNDSLKLFKDEIIFKLLGELDLLMSYIGTVHEMTSLVGLKNTECFENVITINSELREIQKYIIQFSNFLQGARINHDKKIEDLIMPQYGSNLDDCIVYYDHECPMITNFLLCGSGAGLASAQIHVVRAFSRKVERTHLRFWKSIGETPCGNQFLNRLSLYFYSLARYIAILEGNNEIINS